MALLEALRPIRRPMILELAIESGCTAYAAPLGFLEAGAREFAGQIPLILKVNDHDVLLDDKDPSQALTGSVQDALRLGCIGIGFTIYPGSSQRGAHIIKVKLPSDHIEQEAARKSTKRNKSRSQRWPNG